MEKILEETDIDGLESIYPLFSPDKRDKILEIANKHEKLVSGGTDYHADNKPNIKLGSGINNNVNIPSSFIANWDIKIKDI